MLLIIHPLLFCTWFVGQLSRLIFEGLRREAAILEIQRDIRMHLARKSYKELYFAAVSVQLGIRGMASRDKLRFQRQDKAAIMIQVLYTFLVKNCERLHVSLFYFLVHLINVACFSSSSRIAFEIYDFESVLFVYYRVIVANSWPSCTTRGSRKQQLQHKVHGEQG